MLIQITEPDISVAKTDIYNIAIGIDLGTTNSLVAYSKSEDHWEIFPITESSDIMPSVIQFENILVRSIKRLIGKTPAQASEILKSNPDLMKFLDTEANNVKFSTNNRDFTPVEISSMILSKLRKVASEHIKTDITKAVIAVPAYFDEVARSETKLAAEMAGLEVLRLVAEPTAAAYAYGLEHKEEGHFLVYDFGGGTFDVSLLNMRMGVFQVLATSGDVNLGGDDIDLEIAKYFFKEEFAKGNDSEMILSKARSAKEFLSYNDCYKCQAFNICRNQFEDIVRPIINKTLDIVEKVIENPQKIKGILMVGGSTRIPLITKALQERFQIPIFNNLDPDKIVAIGAARHASGLVNGSSNILIDVTPLSLGIELMGGIVDVVVPRNSPLPARKSIDFTNYQDKQTAIKFNIVQGDRPLAKDCRSLAQFELNIEATTAKTARVSLEFFIDIDGILSITAIDKITGNSKKMAVRPSYGITEDDIAKMLKDAFYNAEVDRKNAMLIKIIYEAEDLITALNKSPRIDEVIYYIEDLERQILSQNYDNINRSLEILKEIAIDIIS